MRPFELDHVDIDENAEWEDVLSLMEKIQSGAEAPEVFKIWEPNEGPMIVEVALVAVSDARAWILRRLHKNESDFLARGYGSMEYECVYLGCPEFVQDCCLLSRADAETGILLLIERQEMHSDWHWVPVTRALTRLQE